MRRTTGSNPGPLPRFVVERYAPDLSLEGVRSMEPRLRRAAAALSRAGRPVRYLGSIVITAEETVFSVFEANGPETVAEVNDRAAVPFDRVVPVVELREPEEPALHQPARLATPARETHR
jgi:Nickel responsive protein SCO4226-like